MLATELKPQQVARRRVLVVEDSEVIGRVLRLILEGEGYEVVAARAGAEALALARQRQPHAVTLDLSLPDLDGREVLRRLKADADTHRIPVIVLSTFADGLVGPDRARADEVMAKPFDVDELLDCLKRLTAQ
ncbi:MAG: response regulator [Chloroflexi bacterium]|nr:response regulator [Chloroflexota bacterium]